MCVFGPRLSRLCSALFVFYRLPYLWQDFLHTLHLFVCLKVLPPCLPLPHFLCLCLTAGVFLKNNKVWGRACACVFCAGLTDWMGWLHWAGFLCGPPANFMIYSAKGRGARPPVTTERELHVGLMISPQKCLLWLGLHGVPPARVSEWWRGRGGHLKTRAWLLEGEDRQKVTSDCHVQNVWHALSLYVCVIMLWCFYYFSFSIKATPPSPPNPRIL